MTGMRTTGQLHLGHYLGVIRNMVDLQARYDCFFMMADWHMLTTGLDRTAALRDNTREMLIDWLAAGVDPERATIYVQSAVLETAELHLLLSMVTPVNWLQRDPTLKDMVQNLRMTEESVSYGLLGYPNLQTADILGVDGALVPIGQDQLAHLEISRDVVRRFNHHFGEGVFAEPKPLLAATPVVIGTDGRKMSKSYGNDIKLADAPEVVNAKVMTMVTDPARAKKSDWGHPEVCTVYGFWETFASERAPEIARVCRNAEIGCVQCKRGLAERLNETLAPIRDRRAELERDPARLDAVIADGNARAREATQKTMTRVREAMHLNRYVDPAPAAPQAI